MIRREHCVLMEMGRNGRGTRSITRESEWLWPARIIVLNCTEKSNLSLTVASLERETVIISVDANFMSTNLIHCKQCGVFVLKRSLFNIQRCPLLNRKQDLESHERSGNEDSGDLSEEEEEEEV